MFRHIHELGPSSEVHFIYEQKILIVDDDSDLLDALEFILQRSMFNVQKANSGQSALDLALSVEFDLIVSDLNMSGMSGFDLTRKLRESGIKIPVILMTGSMISREEALSKGVDELVKKPDDVSMISERILHLLKLNVHQSVC